MEQQLDARNDKLEYKFVFADAFTLKVVERRIHPKFRWNIARGYSFAYFGEWYTIDYITSIAGDDHTPLLITVNLKRTFEEGTLPF